LIGEKIPLIRRVTNLRSNYLEWRPLLPGHPGDSAAKTRFSLYLGNSSGPVFGRKAALRGALETEPVAAEAELGIGRRPSVRTLLTRTVPEMTLYQEPSLSPWPEIS
jgi:hypothetical protein